MKTSELVLVDSDVASYIFRQDTRAAAYLPHLEGRVLGLAPVSVGELYRWAELHNWGERRRARLEHYISRFWGTELGSRCR